MIHFFVVPLLSRIAAVDCDTFSRMDGRHWTGVVTVCFVREYIFIICVVCGKWTWPPCSPRTPHCSADICAPARLICTTILIRSEWVCGRLSLAGILLFLQLVFIVCSSILIAKRAIAVFIIVIAWNGRPCTRRIFSQLSTVVCYTDFKFGTCFKS